MITEKEITQTLEKYRERLKSLRGNLKKQEYEYEKRDQFLQGVFQQNPRLILSLFWKHYKEWLRLSEQERNKSPRYSDELFWSIINSKSSKGIVLACQILMESEDLYKERSARFLGDTRDPVAVPFLIEALKSEDYSVVSQSALALGAIGDTRAEPYLLEIVDRYNNDKIYYDDDPLDDFYPIIRENVFSALCLLNTPRARQKILQSLLYDRDKDIQLRAIRYLVAEMPTDARPYLEELAKNNDKDISQVAKSYLEELNSNH